MEPKPIFIYSPQLLQYKFGEGHPFTQKRLLLTLSLMESLGLITPDQIRAPRMATDEEIALVHDPAFIEAVKRAGALDPSFYGQAYGLGTDDVPVFANMHEATAYVVGGSLDVADYVMQTKGAHGVNLSGGLHHAFRAKASGFCVYNDCSIVIAYLKKKYNARVLYVDTDAHHGDGVQWAFYSDPDVMTISFHETGKYLFPGTGNVTEVGEGLGHGKSINVPLDPYTEDDSFLEAYTAVLTLAIEKFRPDVLVTQNGVDAHRYDPLTHLSASTRIYREIPKLAHQLAHEYCEGRWIALGGGGYDIFRVVPRAWTLLWAEMNDQPIEDAPIPSSWVNQWQQESDLILPTHLIDQPFPAVPRRTEIEEKNRFIVERVKFHIT